MREITITIFSTLIFCLLVFFAYLGIQSSKIRLPFFYYDSGLIVNVAEEYKSLWGSYLSQEDIANFHQAENLNLGETYTIKVRNLKQEERLLSVQPIKFEKFDILTFFSLDFLLAFFSVLSAVYFYVATRDGLIFSFFLNLSILFFSNVFLITYHITVFPLFFSIYFSAFLHYHLIYRLRGKEIPSKWLLPQFLIAVVIGVIADQEDTNWQLALNIVNIGHGLNFFFGVFNFTLNLKDLLNTKTKGEALLKRISLLTAIVLYTSMPISILFFQGFPWFYVDRIFFFLSYLFFMITFFYGTYRYTFVPSFVIFTPTIITLILVSFSTVVYISLVLLVDYLLPVPYLKERWFLNFLLLLVLTIYMIPIKLKMKEWIDFWFFEKNPILSKGIEKVTKIITDPISMRRTISSINRTVMETLSISNIIILIPGDTFARTDLRNVNFVRIPAQSEIWNYFANTDRVTVTSHLEYGIGLRETLYNFLKELNIQLAFPAYGHSSGKKIIRAMILLGEKSDSNYFSIGELKFINEIVKITAMLIENYSLLEDEIQKRKIVRDIQTASLVDNTLRIIPPSEIKGIEFAYISKPAVGISGDYLDIISISPSKMIIMLGDVSGHGLGTGFLVSAIKGIVREQLRNGTSLEGLFREINSFFRARYQGSEFMTLIGGVIDTQSKTFRFINAGHLALIEMSPDAKLHFHSKTQRVLGILETDYVSQEVNLGSGTRLFLFSDGVTETFSEKDELFGEESLVEFLSSHGQSAIKDLPIRLEEVLNRFRGNREMTDDMTFISLSFSNL
ncbi:serine phosphatase RsbU [Leptospira ryugenii]|uniref:Serine phosphatase RsbU n=1 Tax=Leptospira ryugenii TaxID=1917863 RepID=A0A2P2E3Y0_9LEPT|nr:PP2C family protein-serine/threonine phosphatase [Leptospira ryugenii]GBF51546.1 serine phosphatase RsbU [Leptospira ryugenii]